MHAKLKQLSAHMGRGVLYRMVAGQVAIGLLLLIAIFVAVWQLNTYNKARRVWIDLKDFSTLISDAQLRGQGLVLVTHRIVITQKPFQYLGAEIPRYVWDVIANSASDLEFKRDTLKEKAASLPEGDPLVARIIQAAEHMDELLTIAHETVDMIKKGNWEGTQLLISQTSETSQIPQFDQINTDLFVELRAAGILIQQDIVKAQDQMIGAGRTAIWISGTVAIIVIALGIVLSFSTIRYITEPINELSSAATKLSGGDFDVRAPATRQDEFGQLAGVFNDMAAKLGERHAKMGRKIQAMNRELQGLRIVIDQAKQKKIIDKITESEYFKQLIADGEKLRQIMNEF